MPYRPIRETAADIRAGLLSPTDLVRETLERIDEQEDVLQAYITVMREQALKDAGQAEQEIRAGHYRGLLHGIPIALKDIIAVKGVRLTAGSRVLDDFVADEDATVVARLREHGAIILGKTTMSEFAYGPYSPPTRNPWKLTHTPGISSSGSAVAVITGMCSGALGTDTGGSVRIPAACCGITALKPTYGRVSCYGVIPLSWSLDHVGPLGRSAEDCALLFDAIAGYDPLDPNSSSRVLTPTYEMLTRQEAGDPLNMRGLKLGIPQEAFVAPLDPEVRTAWQNALLVLVNAGARLTEVELPLPSFSIYRTVQRPEATLVHLERGWLNEKSELYGAATLQRLLTSREITAIDYLRAQDQRKSFSRALRSAMQPIDALVLPTMPMPAIPIEQMYKDINIDGVSENSGDAMLRLTMPFNLAGLPAISVPCGTNSQGLPLGLQIVGQAFNEGLLLRTAHAYQQRTDWHSKACPPPPGDERM